MVKVALCVASVVGFSALGRKTAFHHALLEFSLDGFLTILVPDINLRSSGLILWHYFFFFF